MTTAGDVITALLEGVTEGIDAIGLAEEGRAAATELPLGKAGEMEEAPRVAPTEMTVAPAMVNEDEDAEGVAEGLLRRMVVRAGDAIAGREVERAATGKLLDAEGNSLPITELATEAEGNPVAMLVLDATAEEPKTAEDTTLLGRVASEEMGEVGIVLLGAGAEGNGDAEIRAEENPVGTAPIPETADEGRAADAPTCVGAAAAAEPVTMTVETTVTTTVTVSVSSTEHPWGLLHGSTSGVDVDVPVGADVTEAGNTLETAGVLEAEAEEGTEADSEA